MMKSRSRVPAIALALLAPATAWAQAGPDDESRPYYGDLHVHTRISLDSHEWGGNTNGPGYACWYARNVAALDFVGVADHGFGISDQLWATAYMPVLDSFNDELDPAVDGNGRFVTLLGYEWTSQTHGHRNVFFRTEAVPSRCYDSLNYEQGPEADTSSVTGLWAVLDAWRAQAGGGADYLAIPHAVATGADFDWSPQAVDESRQPVVEVFSKHGNSEGDPNFQPVRELNSANTYRAALARWFGTGSAGYRLGAIASSDTHDGEATGAPPGPEQLDFGPDAPHVWKTTGGLVAIHAAELSRTAVFDALKRRECFGTSGPRIQLWVHVETDLTAGPRPMGSRVLYSNQVRLRIRALGDTAPIEFVQILRGTPESPAGAALVTLAVGADGRVVWEDPAPPSGPAFYYVIAYQQPTTDYEGPNGDPVQLRERAWASPVWTVRKP